MRSEPAWLALLVVMAAVPVTETPPFAFEDAGRRAGLDAVMVFGGKDTNRYLLETTGSGVAMFDYDGDGRQDLFFVNGTTLQGFPKGQEPRPHLYRNRDGTRFEDVTVAAGLNEQWGWGQGACAGDYDNDGHEDLLVTYYGQNRLFHNTGRGRFDDVTGPAGLTQSRLRWNTGCAFIDYDRDGLLDLFVANYIDLDLATAPTPDSGLCRFKGVPVACGPPGLKGGVNLLYHNLGNGRFEDVSERSGITQRQRQLWPRREHARLRQRRVDGHVRRQRFEPERALPQPSRRDLRRRGREGRLRVQPGRQAAGRHGRGRRRLRPQWDDGYPEDELRRRYLDAVRQPWRRLL